MLIRTPAQYLLGGFVSASLVGASAAVGVAQQTIIDPSTALTPSALVQLGVLILSGVMVFRAGSMFRDWRRDMRDALDEAKDVQRLRERVTVLESVVAEHTRRLGVRGDVFEDEAG